MRSARHINEEILVERHAEHGLLRYVNGRGRTTIAARNGISTTCTVYDKDGNEIELHLKNINDRAWNKYLAQRSTPLELGILTNNFSPTVLDFVQWLRAGGYSKPYTYAKTRSARQFILYASILLIAPYFMKHKYQDHAFIDKWVESEMGKILTAQEYAEEIHRATGHALKNSEDLAEAQEATYRKYLTLLEGRQFISYEPLPALPVGYSDPLAISEEEEEIVA